MPGVRQMVAWLIGYCHKFELRRQPYIVQNWQASKRADLSGHGADAIRLLISFWNSDAV